MLLSFVPLFWPSNEDRPLKALKLPSSGKPFTISGQTFWTTEALLGKLKIYIYDQQCSSFSRLIIAATTLAIWLPSMMTIMLVEVEPKKKKQLLLVFWVVDVQKENDCNFDLDDVPKCRRSCLLKPKKLSNYKWFKIEQRYNFIQTEINKLQLWILVQNWIWFDPKFTRNGKKTVLKWTK